MQISCETILRRKKIETCVRLTIFVILTYARESQLISRDISLTMSGYIAREKLRLGLI